MATQSAKVCSDEMIEAITSKNKSVYTKLTTSLTVERAKKGMQISALSRHYGEGNVTKMIVTMLDDVCSSMDIDFGDGTKFIEIAEILQHKYFHYRLEDLALMLYRGKTGAYGVKNLYRFNLLVIEGWILIYDAERSEHSYGRNQSF